MTMKLYGSVNILELDAPKLTATFRKIMERRNREAIRAYIRAVLTRVPVYTGMARASIKYADGPNGPLASWLGVSITISPIREYLKPQKYYPDGKNIQAGQARGFYTVQMGPTTFSFSFNSEVPHYYWNEYWKTLPNVKGKWQSNKYGAKAYEKEFRKGVIKGFPGLKPFFRVTAVLNQAP